MIGRTFNDGEFGFAWNAEADPGRSACGLIRYRSRRDLLEGVTDASFGDGHIYKVAALRMTYAMPSELQAGLLLSPRVWPGLVLTSLAALVHLTVLLRRQRKARI